MRGRKSSRRGRRRRGPGDQEHLRSIGHARPSDHHLRLRLDAGAVRRRPPDGHHPQRADDRLRLRPLRPGAPGRRADLRAGRERQPHPDDLPRRRGGDRHLRLRGPRSDAERRGRRRLTTARHERQLQGVRPAGRSLLRQRPERDEALRSTLFPGPHSGRGSPRLGLRRGRHRQSDGDHRGRSPAPRTPLPSPTRTISTSSPRGMALGATAPGPTTRSATGSASRRRASRR